MCPLILFLAAHLDILGYVLCRKRINLKNFRIGESNGKANGMQNEYLEVLGLAPGASKNEIKRAFRNLSKQYHPDVNKDADAQKQFIAIHEAYKFLTRVGPSPNNERVSYDYDPRKAAYAEWRKKAQHYAWKKAREAKRQQELQLRLIFRYFSYYAAFLLLFNFLIALDYLLPKKESVDRVVSVHNPVMGNNYHHNNQSQRYYDIRFENFNMKFDWKEAEKLQNVREGLIVHTSLFKTPLYAVFAADDKKVTMMQIYGVYQVFGFLIPASFIVLCLFRFSDNLDFKTSLALLLIFFSIIQLFLFFRY